MLIKHFFLVVFSIYLKLSQFHNKPQRKNFFLFNKIKNKIFVSQSIEPTFLSEWVSKVSARVKNSARVWPSFIRKDVQLTLTRRTANEIRWCIALGHRKFVCGRFRGWPKSPFRPDSNMAGSNIITLKWKQIIYFYIILN